jgi:hypothetical protein
MDHMVLEQLSQKSASKQTNYMTFFLLGHTDRHIYRRFHLSWSVEHPIINLKKYTTPFKKLLVTLKSHQQKCKEIVYGNNFYSMLIRDISNDGTFCVLTDWLTDILTDWQTYRPTDWETYWMTDRHTDRLTDRYTDRLTDWQTYRPTDWETYWMTNRHTDRLTERHTD